MVGHVSILAILAVGFLFFGGLAVVFIALIARGIGRRKVDRQQFHELREDISRMKDSIEDLREQVADIIIRLG